MIFVFERYYKGVMRFFIERKNYILSRSSEEINTELLALLGGLSFAILSLIMPFKRKYKFIFIIIGFTIIVISFINKNKTMDIIT